MHNNKKKLVHVKYYLKVFKNYLKMAMDAPWILKYKHLWSSSIQKMSKEKSSINKASNGTANQAILNVLIDSVEQPRMKVDREKRLERCHETE